MAPVALSNAPDEAVCVDHLVQQRFDEVLPWPQLQQGLAETDNNRMAHPVATTVANSCAGKHSLAPLNLHALQF